MTRRTFVGTTLAGSIAAQSQPGTPWYRRTYRWGQTNITEKDPDRYDIAWWREYWKRTRTQGVIINAGGIVAYYPSKFPLHHRAEFLKDRDLYGELAAAAHKDGIVVLARMDSNRTAEDFYKAYPAWFARDIEGRPYRAADKYVTCINSAYYDEYLPGILREIIERSKPEGFADNSWAGLGRGSICYCENCQRKFRQKTGKALPRKHDWDDDGYRQWILWSYARRLEVWDQNNRVTKDAGGPDCLWIGMNSGSVAGQCRSFRDMDGIFRRSEIALLDHQRRDDSNGFQENAGTGKLIHGLLGWNKLAPESMAMYQNARNSMRLAAKPAAEARMWMIAGFAGGIQPWWHHVGAWHEDRRAYLTAEPVMRWHEANEQYLVNREPVASVGLVWSQRNTDFYGRDRADDLTEAPYRGWMQALVRARIPYLPVHVDHDLNGFSTLILPNLGAMSDAQCAAIRKFVERGGSLIATGASSLFTGMGDPRPDFALADLFRAHADKPPDPKWAASSYHTYLRMTKHAALSGFDGTDILAYGGMLGKLRVEPDATVPLTFIPPFPVSPPETAWMREPKTDIPGLVLSTHAKGGRIAYMPADIDRRYTRDFLPDHANLLANLVRWASGGTIPLEVNGRGLIDCHLYRQPGRLILHLVNLTSAGTWRAPIDELIPVGPFRVRVRVPKAQSVKLLVATGEKPALAMNNGWASIEIKSILDHEVAVIL